ncbi:hypothetical protein CR969_02765 [Candidatus Saccharibacteria bacterium]|nr:MAG: hypothetical protein CR969_02765 [Candidatus Saccharibacteria bacterium]
MLDVTITAKITTSIYKTGELNSIKPTATSTKEMPINTANNIISFWPGFDTAARPNLYQYIKIDDNNMDIMPARNTAKGLRTSSPAKKLPNSRSNRSAPRYPRAITSAIRYGIDTEFLVGLLFLAGCLLWLFLIIALPTTAVEAAAAKQQQQQQDDEQVGVATAPENPDSSN